MAFFNLFLVVVGILLSESTQAVLDLPTVLQSKNQSSGVGPLGVPPVYPECFPPELFKSRLADSRDCLRSVMMLPTSGDSGTFRNGRIIPTIPDSDQFLLPLSRVHGQCNVTVSIAESVSDECSWGTISNVANQLAQTCSKGYYPNGKSGGVTYTGREKYIRVSMGHVGFILDSYYDYYTTTSSGNVSTS